MLSQAPEDIDPLAQFEGWYQEACEASIPGRDSAALATATTRGAPSVRMVSFKGLYQGGFSFCTNHSSRKCQELEANPQAALLFYWLPLRRQVRVEGRCRRLDQNWSDDLFQARDRESQLTAIASRQSEVLLSRESFERQIEELKAATQGQPLTRPEYWGALVLIPEQVEFWSGGPHRRHHRVLYRRDGSQWNATQLYP